MKSIVSVSIQILRRKADAELLFNLFIHLFLTEATRKF